VIPRISERTSFELAHPAAPGQRHDQLVRIACSLRQNGFSSEAIFVQLCVSQPEIPRREVAAIVRWVEQRVSGARVTRGKNPLRWLREPHPISPAEAKGNVERFLGQLASMKLTFGSCLRGGRSKIGGSTLYLY
jgi:hypothetical protein